MPIYDLRCANGHTAEVIQSFVDPLPTCAECGATTAKLPASFGIGGGRGTAGVPPAPEAMPQTWKGTYGGNRDYVTSLRRTAEQRKAFEQRHPEVAGDRRPIVAHEGRYEGSPLRRGDPLPSPSPPAHSHPHPHPH